MPTNHSNKGRRHRGRRGRRSGNRDETQQLAPDAPEAETTVIEAIAPEPPVLAVEAEATAQPARQQRRPASIARGNPDPRAGQRPAGRRRNQPRPVVGPMPTAVLKRHVMASPPDHARETRPVSSMTSTDVANFGCPMLTRIATRMPATGYQNAPRCSMAWALHNEDEALLCMYTADLIECWKAHPEKVEGLRARIAEDAAAPAAD